MEFLFDSVDVPLVIDPVDNCVGETLVAISVTNSVIGPLVEFVIDRVVKLVIDPVDNCVGEPMVATSAVDCVVVPIVVKSRD